MPDFADLRERSRRQRALAAGMLLTAVALLFVEVTFVEPARTWVWVERLFWHPLAVWCLATVLAVSAFWIGLRSSVLAILGTSAAVLVFVPGLLVGVGVSAAILCS